VGHVFPGPRAELIDLLKARWPRHFVGTAYLDEMARVYSAARLAFNRSVNNDVNMRVFEAVACGSLLLTNDLSENGQAELFTDGVHLATYRDADELLGRVAYYLEHEDQREAIAAAGRAEAMDRHTYRHRKERLLAEAEARLSRVVVGGAEVGGQPQGMPHVPSAPGHILSPGHPGEARIRDHSAGLPHVPSAPGHILSPGHPGESPSDAVRMSSLLCLRHPDTS
jgi:hypothetical protein